MNDENTNNNDELPTEVIPNDTTPKSLFPPTDALRERYPTYNDSSTLPGMLPRIDLREHAFKKYERFIAKALEGSYLVDSKLELNINAHTFVTRFRDAILGFKRYRYHSTLLQQGEKFEYIKLWEKSDHEVYVQNTVKTAPAGMLRAGTDSDKILDIIKKMWNHAPGYHPYELLVSFALAEDRDDLILSCAEQFGMDETYYRVLDNKVIQFHT